MRFAQLMAMLAATAAGVPVVAVQGAPGTFASAPGADGAARFAEAVERDFRSIINLVWKAVDERVNGGKPQADRQYVDIEAVFADRAVIRYNSRYFAYPYTIETKDGTDVVNLGAPVEVVEQYVPVTGSDPVQKTTEALREAINHGAETESTFTEAADGSIQVTLIKAGASGNGNFYGDAALREAVPLFEGVRVFAKSDAEHLAGKGKDVRNLIGGVYGVKFVEGKAADTGRLVGTFKPIDPNDAVATKMTEAVKRGLQSLMGLSIDASARTKTRVEGGKRLREATKFTKVHSVDLIVEPGAGGGLDRLTEAAAEPSLTGEKTMPLWKQRMLEAIKAKDAAKHAAIDVEKIGDDELVQLHEAVCGSLVPPVGQTRLTEATGDDAPVTRAELQMIELRGRAATKIAGSKLPQVAKDKLATQFAGTARFTEAEVDAAITAEGAYLARFTESGSVRLPAFAGIEVGDRSVQMKDMLDAFFDPGHKNHRSVSSFKECYVEITGDRKVTGRLADMDMSRLAESLGDSSMRESVISSTFANALGDSMTRRMQQVFTGLTRLMDWKKVATWGPVNDFRSQERIRIGGYGNLPAVAQSGAYTALTTPGDEKATYAVSKRGGTEDVTIEAIANDDVQALRRIPQEMALAAGNTLYEFVFDFYRTNPTIYDTVALYHASHNNLLVAALDAAQYAAHRLLMVKQTRAGSSKRMGVEPRAILVPWELQETAYNLFVRNQNNDKTFVQSINPEVIVPAYWTDANDWCTVADPSVLPVLEIGFLGGREEPELFVQDMPNVGSMFSNDKLTYKIRHIYGGNVLVDGFKGTTKAVVP